jgi:hypothetical protein
MSFTNVSSVVLLGSMFALAACTAPTAAPADTTPVGTTESALNAPDEPTVETVSEAAIDSGEVSEIAEDSDGTAGELAIRPHALRATTNSAFGVFSIPSSLCRNGCIIFLAVLQDVWTTQGALVAPVLTPAAPRAIAPTFQTRPIRAHVATSAALQLTRYRLVAIVFPLFSSFATHATAGGHAVPHVGSGFVNPMDAIDGIEQPERLVDGDYDAANDFGTGIVDVEE